MRTISPSIRKVCPCGTLIWEGALPTFQETITCRSCKADHTRTPPLSWRIRWGVRQLRKRLRLLGWSGMLELGIRTAFMTYPERERIKQQRKAEAHGQFDGDRDPEDQSPTESPPAAAAQSSALP